jgi:small conductance mechanosensitive channel
MPTEDINQTIDTITGTDWLSLYVIPWGGRIVLALVIFIVGRWIARWLTRVFERGLSKARMDAMLVRFLGSIAYWALFAVVALAALEQLGVNTTSALAVLGAAGLALGLALKDSLANFAAGVMLIIFRPFRVGQFVEVAGIMGIVEEIRIFSTLLRTPDNREITVPNGHITSGTITNFAARDTRRIDMMFGISYSDDIKKAKTLMEQVLNKDERILKEPAPQVMLLELADSSVNFAVRPWVKSSDYWDVRASVLEEVKASFDSNGISIPFPQRDVHLFQEKAA